MSFAATTRLSLARRLRTSNDAAPSLTAITSTFPILSLEAGLRLFESWRLTEGRGGTRQGQRVQLHGAAQSLTPYLAALRHGSCPERLEDDAARDPRSDRAIRADHGWRARRGAGGGAPGR